MTEIHAFDPDGTPSPGAEVGVSAIMATTLDPQVASLIGRSASTATAAAIDQAYRRGFSVKEWGAKGDGTTDDSFAFQDALATGRPVYVPSGTYRVSNVVVRDTPVHLTLARGAVLDHLTSGAAITVAGTESSTSTPLSADAATRGRTITAPGSGLKADDWVRLGSARLFDSKSTNVPYGELVQVESVSGDVITTTAPISGGPYTTSDGAFVRKVSLVDGVRIDGPGAIRGAKVSDRGQTGIEVRLARNVRIAGITSSDIDRRHVFLPDCVDFEVENCSFDWAIDSGMAYAVSVANSAQDGKVRYCTMRNVRHAFTTNNEAGANGVVRRILVALNIARTTSRALGGSQGGGDAFDSHTAAEDIWFEQNQVHGSTGQGINFEGRSGRIVGNWVRNTAGDGIYFHNESDLEGSVVVEGNLVEDAGGRGIQVRPGGRGTLAGIRGIVVSRNTVRRSTHYGLQVGGISGPRVTGLRFFENVIEDNINATAVTVTNTEYVSQGGNTASGGGTAISVTDLAPPPAGGGDAVGFLIRTVASGAVSVLPTTTYLRIGVAEGDVLQNITGGSRGQVIVVRLSAAASTLPVQATGGNIRITSPLTLTGNQDTLTLGYTGSVWAEVSRAKF